MSKPSAEKIASFYLRLAKGKGTFVDFLKEEGKTKVKNPDTGNEVQLSSLKGPKGRKLVQKKFEGWKTKGKAFEEKKSPKKPPSPTPSHKTPSPLFIKHVKDIKKSLEKFVKKKGKETLIDKEVSELSHSELTLINSLALFTSPEEAHPRVVSPNRNSPGILKTLKNLVIKPEPIPGQLFKGGRRHWVPNTQENFRRANTVLTALAATPVKKGSVPTQHRGMLVDSKFMGKLKEGETLKLPPITSFTQDKKPAKFFALRDYITSPNMHPISFILESSSIKRGTDISNLSYFPKEKEFVSSGSLKILSSKS